MLVLSRKRNEKIVIGEEITVTVLEVRGDQVQIGIDAPRAIPVHRHEVYVAIHEGERAAADSPASAENGSEGVETPDDDEASTSGD